MIREFLAEFNLDVLFKIMILLGFALFFFLIIKNGQVLIYVHPRIVPYMYFAIIAIILMVLFSLPDLRKGPNNSVCLSYLIFLLPLLTAFMPPQTMDASPISFGSTKAGVVSSDDSAGDPSISSRAEESLSARYSDSDQESEVITPDIEILDGPIVVDDNNFFQWSQEIFIGLDAYAGMQIEATGFILRDEQFETNDFALARLLMTCCVADTVPIGFLCRYENSANLEELSWIKVTGNIQVVDYNGQTWPVIVIDKLEKTSKPKNEYVYPY